jgi:hypothetical protein
MSRERLRRRTAEQDDKRHEQAPGAIEELLALQRTAGNQAVARAVESNSHAARLARQPQHAPADAPAQPAAEPDFRVREVDRQITETISHAPAAFAAWNGTYSWRAKWRLKLDLRAEVGQLVLAVRLHSTASDAVKRAWTNAISRKWSSRFAFCVLREHPVTIRPGVVDDVEEMYPIRIRPQWVANPRNAHYVVTANAAGADEGGRAGLGGTTSMTGWGSADTVDITHEFGHMLGCPEEYFTTDGVDYTRGGTLQGFRDPRGGVMNNPAGPALARNFSLIRREAASLRGVPLAKTAIRPWR